MTAAEDTWATASADVIVLLYARHGTYCDTARHMMAEGRELPPALVRRCEAAREKWLREQERAR